MKSEFKFWRQFINEREQIVQNAYLAHFVLSLAQKKEIDRTEVMNFMRAIPNVTTVYREKEISSTKQSFTAEYSVRFVLKHGHSAKKYHDTILKPGLRSINGLSIQVDKGYEKIGGK